MKKFFQTLLKKRHLAQSLKELKRLETALPSARSRLAIPFAFRGAGFFKSIECMQNPFEIEEFFNRICELRPKRVLEIGTARGGALYLWLQAATSDATVVSVDLPGGAFGGGYGEERIPLYNAFARPLQTLHLLRADSHVSETLQNVKTIFGREQIDFLFIDGDHTYDGVKKDFEQYGPLVRQGGLIGFHDILPRPNLPDIQVDRFWNEIKQQYPSHEIIGQGRKIGCGLIEVT